MHSNIVPPQGLNSLPIRGQVTHVDIFWTILTPPLSSFMDHFTKPEYIDLIWTFVPGIKIWYGEN